MKVYYRKLVRDAIPEIIRKSGKRCKTESIPHAEYLVALYRKMEEELAEYRANPCLEELADLLEVIRATAVARGYTVEELESVRAKKAASRGSFERRVYLQYVEE